MERGWDPEVKKFLRKITVSLFLGFLWMLAAITGGIFFELGYPSGKPVIYTILFYSGITLALILMLRYFYKIWK
ncbi:MAG: hypothetical protein N2747_04815 [Chitinophagaceae bacterium]|nr:hypothetical protein [Chitinophagaceae bacterium]